MLSIILFKFHWLKLLVPYFYYNYRSFNPTLTIKFEGYKVVVHINKRLFVMFIHFIKHLMNMIS